MFNIMENRKRPRFETINSNNNTAHEGMQGVATTATSLGTATLATIGGQSNSASSSLPANIFLTICDDDNSNDSEEYILDHSMLTPIKQEQTVATQTNNNATQLQQTNLVPTLSQYRIVNQAGKTLNTTSPNSSSIINSTTVNANNSVNLTPGCEIYVIKEVYDSPKEVIAESNNNISIGTNAMMANGTAIKPGQIFPLPVLRNSTLNGNNNQNQNANSIINNNTISSTSNTSSISPNETAKRSLILEAYKKRDDKRRATHNEVERRRRNKINSWIFKLKEMLPSEGISCNKDATTTLQEEGTAATTRTPPNDSKSQILIKACKYIKSMKEEIDSLRECLTENENLRLKNERLQEEINNLRTRQRQPQKLYNSNNILLTTNTTSNSNNSSHDSDNYDNCEITLNSLNTTYANVQLFAPSTNQNSSNHQLVDLVGLTTNSDGTISKPNSVNVRYNKRQLIVTDYDD